MFEKFFKLSENGTSVKTELSAGATTFLTMAYIIFVQPAILSQCGMDFGSVMMATCLSAAVASIFMGLAANYPIALAPGMGENFFFTFTVVIAMGVPWESALAIVFISGLIFFILTIFRIREMVINSVPESLKAAIAAGIGVLIAFIGLADAGIIVRNNSGLAPIAFMDKSDISSIDFLLSKFSEFEYASGALKLGDLGNPATILAVFGLLVVSVLMVRKMKGAILIGILATLIAGLFTNLIQWNGIMSAPPSMEPTLLKLDFHSIFSLHMIPVILVFLFMDMFDTIGTFIGVTKQAGLMKNGKLPRAQQALMADAFGTMAGALLGTSTVTSFIESSSGVEAGGRTGLTSVWTGILFLLAIFFHPLVQMIGGGVEMAGGLYLHPVTAPALIVVGAMMARNIGKLDWLDYSEAIPAFLVIVGMPLTYSIADGLAFGFITYPILKLASGRGKECSTLMYILGGIFVLRYVFL